MKDKVLYLILGMLVGAVVTALIFTVLMRNNIKGDRPEGSFSELPKDMGNFVMPENAVRPEKRERGNSNFEAQDPSKEVTEN